MYREVLLNCRNIRCVLLPDPEPPGLSPLWLLKQADACHPLTDIYAIPMAFSTPDLAQQHAATSAMAQSTPSSKRRRILVHCSTATGPTQTVELDSAEPIVSTPSSNAVKRGIQHLYDGLPSEQLTYLRVDRKQGEPWEAMVSSDPMLARVKSRQVSAGRADICRRWTLCGADTRQTRVAHESEQRRMTTLERELEWLKKKDKERDAEMKARDAEFKALAALHMDRIEALELSNIGHEVCIVMSAVLSRALRAAH